MEPMFFSLQVWKKYFKFPNIVKLLFIINSKIKTKYTNKSLIYNKVETKDTTVNHIILITIFAIVVNHKTNPSGLFKQQNADLFGLLTMADSTLSLAHIRHLLSACGDLCTGFIYYPIWKKIGTFCAPCLNNV